MLDIFAQPEKKCKKGSKAEKELLDEQFMMQLQQRFNMRYLINLFTVTTDKDDKEGQSTRMKCMPNSYAAAIRVIDKLYKSFNQTYIDSRTQGTMNSFTCDFIQDQSGRF